MSSKNNVGHSNIEIVQWCVDVCKEWSHANDLQEVADLYSAWTYLRLIIIHGEKKIGPGDLCTLNCHFNPLVKNDELFVLTADPFTQPREVFEEYVSRAKYEGVNPHLIACLLVNASTIDTPVVFRKHMFAEKKEEV
jgi:hypothetical protein